MISGIEYNYNDKKIRMFEIKTHRDNTETTVWSLGFGSLVKRDFTSYKILVWIRVQYIYVDC